MNSVCYWTVNWLVNHYVCSIMLHRSALLRFVLFLSIFCSYSYFYLFVLFLCSKICVVITLIHFTPHQTFFGWRNQGIWGERGMWHVWGRREMGIYFRSRNLNELEHLEDLRVSERILLKCILNKYGWMSWTELIWFRIYMRQSLINTQIRLCAFDKILEFSSQAEEISTSQGLCSVDLLMPLSVYTHNLFI